jgi:PhnB protein
MAHLNAYIKFNGNARKAFAFYKDCLGGELTLLTVG